LLEVAVAAMMSLAVVAQVAIVVQLQVNLLAVEHQQKQNYL
jgi:hypothetical protein